MLTLRNEKGFTLVELLISMTITAILAGVIFSAFSLCNKISHHNSNKIAAINVLKSKLEEIRGDIKINQFANLGSWDGEVTDHVLSDGPTAAKKDDVEATLTITITGKDVNDTDVALNALTLAYVQIEAVIVWDFLGPPFTENMTLETNVTL